MGLSRNSRPAEQFSHSTGLTTMFNQNKHLTTSQEQEQKTINLEYEITYKPLPHSSLKLLPSEVMERVEDLYLFAQSHPDQAIAPLLALLETHPNVPVFYRYLQAAYEMTDQEEKAQALAEEAYQKHPDYLFAKTNYALLCLERQNSDEIVEIFERKFDLKLLYPQREVFHIDEFVALSSVMALYYYAIGNRKDAEVSYRLLKEFSPDNDMTLVVHYHLYATFWQRLSYEAKQKLDALKNANGLKVFGSKKSSGYSREF